MTESQENKLYDAVRNGDLKFVRQALAGGLSVNYVFNSATHKPTLLHLAIQGHQLPMLRLLVEAGADINKQDEANYTPLDEALAVRLAHGAAYLHNRGAKPVRQSLEVLKAGLLDAQNTLHEVVLTRPLAHRYLSEVFNFQTREYAALILKEKNGPVECFSLLSFDDVKNTSRLREAFEEYRNRGGTADEGVLAPFWDNRVKKPLFRNGGR